MSSRDDIISIAFHEAKLARKLVRVVDIYNRTFEGRIYRNSYDRANVVTLDGKDAREEIYYSNIIRSSDQFRKTHPIFLEIGTTGAGNTKKSVVAISFGSGCGF
jgi:hypothetical protein